MARIMSQGQKKFCDGETTSPKIKPLMFSTHVSLKKSPPGWFYKVDIKNPLDLPLSVQSLDGRLWAGDITIDEKTCFLLFIFPLSNKKPSLGFVKRFYKRTF